MFTTYNKGNYLLSFLDRFQFFRNITSQIVSYYSNTLIDSTIQSHFDFSSLSSSQIIFGSMQSAHQDPGYTQYIYQIGIIGLVITIIYYLVAIFHILSYREKRNTISFIPLIAIISCFILSIKNSYLLARHVSEYIIIVLSMFIQQNSINNKLLEY